jgi:hypothetical protein
MSSLVCFTTTLNEHSSFSKILLLRSFQIVPPKIAYYTCRLLLLFGAFLDIAFLKRRHRRMDLEDLNNYVSYHLREIAFSQHYPCILQYSNLPIGHQKAVLQAANVLSGLPLQGV